MFSSGFCRAQSNPNKTTTSSTLHTPLLHSFCESGGKVVLCNIKPDVQLVKKCLSFFTQQVFLRVTQKCSNGLVTCAGQNGDFDKSYIIFHLRGIEPQLWNCFRSAAECRSVRLKTAGVSHLSLNLLLNRQPLCSVARWPFFFIPVLGTLLKELKVVQYVVTFSFIE